MLPAHDSITVDDEYRSAQPRCAKRDAVLPGNRQHDIGEKRQREAVLAGEPLMAIYILRANAPHGGAEVIEVAQVRCIGTQLPGADGRVCLLYTSDAADE